MSTDTRVLALSVLFATAPIALVLVVALLRGYSITLHMSRKRHGEGD